MFAVFLSAKRVLVIEGELNGMACAVVRRNGDDDLAVMGVAGANGTLWLEALEGKEVYVYGDGDTSGQQAKERWAKDAYDAGADNVFTLEPWEMDACDIMGKLGKEALRERLS